MRVVRDQPNSFDNGNTKTPKVSPRPRDIAFIKTAKTSTRASVGVATNAALFNVDSLRG